MKNELRKSGGLRAVVKCTACGHITKGEAVPLPGDEIYDAGMLEHFLCEAVSGLMQKKGSYLTCPSCGGKILEPGAKLFLMYDAGKEAIH